MVFLVPCDGWQLVLGARVVWWGERPCRTLSQQRSASTGRFCDDVPFTQSSTLSSSASRVAVCASAPLDGFMTRPGRPHLALSHGELNEQKCIGAQTTANKRMPHRLLRNSVPPSGALAHIAIRLVRELDNYLT